MRLISPRLNQGGEADIFRAEGLKGCVAKVYHSRNGMTHASKQKLQAMLDRPPQTMAAKVDGTDLPLFAWPTHIVEDDAGNCAGFLMPEISLDRAVTLQTYMWRTVANAELSVDDRSLPRRLRVCRNLASVIAEIHRQSHYFVDIKPQNIYMFKDTGIVCLVDNDSFSIASPGGGPRFPASAYSSEYMAPELIQNNLGPNSVVNDTQDRFALAVLIFQILNQGLHPFQGIPTIPREEWNIDLCIKLGYYAYGQIRNNNIKPHFASVHECWDFNTRQLFDRAFTAPPSQRPSADEWRRHLDSLQDTKGSFERCDTKPTDVLHIHFSGRPCPECMFDQFTATATHQASTSQAASVASTSIPASNTQSSVQTPGPINGNNSPSGTPSQSNSKNWLYWVVAAAIGFAMYYLSTDSKNRSLQEVPAPAPAAAPAPTSSTQPAAPTVATVPNSPQPQQAPVAINQIPAPQESPASQSFTSEQIKAARNLSTDADSNGMQARVAVVKVAVKDATRQNINSLMEIIQTAHAGDDNATLSAAQGRMRNTEYTSLFAGWQRLRKEARQINETTRADYRGNLDQAIGEQTRAFALDPYDREVTGNLAFFLALTGKSDSAFNVATYALSLPRQSNETGRSADWQLIGSMLALKGQAKDATGAFFVGLAISRNLSGFCRSLIAQEADFGDALKGPVTAVFKRINDRGQSDADGCTYPPVWQG